NDLPTQNNVYVLEKDQNPAVPVQQASKPESREFYVYERKELDTPAPKPAEQQVFNLDGPSHNTPRQENQAIRIENQYSSPAVQPENRVEPQYYRNAEQNEQKQLAQYNQNQIKPDSDPTSQGQFDFVNDTEEKKRILYDQSMDRIKRLKNLNTPMDVNPDD